MPAFGFIKDSGLMSHSVDRPGPAGLAAPTGAQAEPAEGGDFMAYALAL
jgi:hypothetical protein